MPELPTQTDGVLSEIQAQAVATLKSDAYFAGMSIIQEDLQDLVNTIQTSLAKLGLCVLVQTPDATFKYPDAPGPIMDTITVSVQVIENVLINRGTKGTRKPAGQVAEYVAWLLHNPNHAGTRSDTYRLIATRMRIIPNKAYLVRQIDFETTGSLAGIVSTTEE